MRPIYKYLFLISFCFTSFGVLAQKQIPPKPKQLVSDFANALSPSERSALERKLVAYNDTTSTQIAVVIDRSLDGAEIFDYSYKLAKSWGIGQQDDDNGILIYVAFSDRKLRIQTGYGAEGFLPDAMAKRIVDQVITPAFKRGQYYQGLNKATDIIIQLAEGEYDADALPKYHLDDIVPVLVILLIIVLVIVASRNDGDDDGGYYRGGRYNRRQGGGWILLGGGGGSGTGSFGGGGGFGGFGGGGFGGGGAGGSW